MSLEVAAVGKKKLLVLNSKTDARAKYGSLLESGTYQCVYLTDHLIDPARYLEDISPDLLLVSLEWLPQWRIFIANARRRDIPTVYSVDGVLDWTYTWNNQAYIGEHGTAFQPLLSDYLCVIGAHQARLLASLGLKNNIRIVGLPRLENFSRDRIIRPDRTPTILIATANTWSLNDEHAACVRQALRDLKAYFDASSCVKPVWRISKELAREIDVELSFEGTLEQSLCEVTGLVSFVSTVLLEGMLKGVPTCLIDYRSEPVWVETAWQIRSREHIPRVVQELISPSLEKLAYQRFCLEDELESEGPEHRFSEVIATALQWNGSAIHELESGQSGPIDFMRVHSQISAFSIKSEALLQYELDACYKHIDNNREQMKLVQRWINESLAMKFLRGLKKLFGGGDISVVTRINRFLGEELNEQDHR